MTTTHDGRRYSRLMGGRAADGSRPTLDTVARAAGVSRSLVSFALNGRPGVSAEKRAAIIAIADELGYLPDPLARELRTGRSQMFGFIVRNIANPFFNDVLAGMQEAAFEKDITVVAMDSEYSEDKERRHIRTLAARRAGALAIAPVGAAGAIGEWLTARPDGRTVLVNSSMRVADGVPRVAPDSVAAVTSAVEHLVALGHRDIAFLTAPAALMSDTDRLEIYLAVCAGTGLTPRPVQMDLQGEAIATGTRSLLAGLQAPTAIITNSDHAAHFVYRAARDAGVRIGDGLSVVGHDDLSTSALLDPPLTTVRLDRRALGRATFERLSGDATGDLAMPVQLIARRSTATPGR